MLCRSIRPGKLFQCHKEASLPERTQQKENQIPFAQTHANTSAM